MKVYIKLIPILLVMVTIWSCYPGSVSTSELDTVVTLYDETYDFSQINTFHLADTIVVIGEGNDDITNFFDDDVIERTRQNLINIGYVEEPDASQADVYVFLEKTRSDLVIVTPPPCYYCWYPGYPGYPPYYPWYSPGYVYTYPVGTLFANMYETDSETHQAPARWGYRINGLITGSNEFIMERLDRSIDQAFTQSPYLGK